MFDTLIAVDHAKDMALRPALAERWERIGPRALRLSLRQGVVFHDGSPFAAEDVAFTFSPDHLLGPGKSGRSIAMQSLERIERIEIVDPQTVIVHAKGDDALLEQRLAAWAAEIVSKRAFDAAGSWDRWIAAPIGTGPYRLMSQKLDVNVVLAPHDAYWGGKPPFDGIEFRYMPELSTRLNGLMTGQVDLITDVPPDQFSEIAKRPELEVAGGAVQNIRYLAIDAETPGLTDPRARRALSLAIDRKLFVESLWADRVPVPRSFQLPGFGPGYIEDYPPLAYDPDLARKLLKDAGYRGETITYRLLNNYYTNQVSGAQVMVEMWQAVGLKVRIEMMENFSQIQKKPVRALYDSSSTAVFRTISARPGASSVPTAPCPSRSGSGATRSTSRSARSCRTRSRSASAASSSAACSRSSIAAIRPASCCMPPASSTASAATCPGSPGQTLDLNFGPSNAAFSRT